MDYTPASCSNMFTHDQAEYARLVLQNESGAGKLVNNFQYGHADYPADVSYELTAAAISCKGENQNLTLTVYNEGDSLLEQLTIEYGTGLNNIQSRTWCGIVKPGQSAEIKLPPLNIASGNKTIYARVVKANNLPYSGQLTSTITYVSNRKVMVEALPGRLGGQIDVIIEEVNGNVIWESAFPNFKDDVVSDVVCVEPGECYNFTIENPWASGEGFGGNQSYTEYIRLIRSDGAVLYELTGDDGWNGDETGLYNICVPAQQPNSAIIGYYNFMGESLPAAPSSGWYIVRYADFTYQKIFKR